MMAGFWCYLALVSTTFGAIQINTLQELDPLWQNFLDPRMIINTLFLLKVF